METDPPTLLAVLIAARRSGDRALARAARRLLRESHGIAVSFIQTDKTKEQVSP